MTKRKAEFDLDRDQIAKDDQEFIDQQRLSLNKSVGTIQTPEEIAQRRILKIKSTKPEENEKKEQKFFLSKPLETEPKTVFSEIPSQIIKKSPIKFQSPEKLPEKSPQKQLLEPVIKTLVPEEKTIKSPAKLDISPSKLNKSPIKSPIKEKPFGFLASIKDNVNEKQPLNNLFNNSNSTPQSTFASLSNNLNPNPSSLFSKPETNILTTQPNFSLFMNNNTVKPPIQEQPNPQVGLFGAQPSGGLFGVPSSGSLFGAPQSGGLFSSPQTGGLFGAKQNNNLFGNLGSLNGNNDISKPSLFGGMQGNLFAKKDDNSEDDEGNDDEEDGTKSPEIDITKSSGNFQYAEDFSKEIHKPIHKFKVNDKDAVEGGFLSIEKHKENSGYIVIYRTPAKLISYKGWLVKKISKTGVLNKKNDSMTLLLVNEAKKDGKTVLEKDMLKLMFISVKDCEEFKKKCEELIE